MRTIVAVFLLLSMVACDRSQSAEFSVPGSIILGSKLSRLFENSKLVCFGRYVLSVPVETTLIWGSASFPSRIDSFQGGTEEMKSRVEADIDKLRAQYKTFDLTFNGPGPVPDSWQIRYYEDSASKRFDLHSFTTYVLKKDRIFILLDSAGVKTEDEAVTRQARLASGLRLRQEDEVPLEPGYCMEHAFVASSDYSDQEMVNVGIFLPSLPDVTFSISSNKDAYADYPKAEFERMKKEELSLLSRIRQAQQEQGLSYPHRTVLREGKRAVQHWEGEESLIKRTDGVHDFEWGFVGTPIDVANPAELIVNMYTKVEHNTVGAAKTASVNDEEAVALWDKLLSQFKFRVEVPGSPTSSYVYPSSGKGKGVGSN